MCSSDLFPSHDKWCAYLNTVEKYDPVLNTWTYVATMQTTRESATAFVIDGKAYVAGGFGDSVTLNTVETYDPVSNSWETTYTIPYTSTKPTIRYTTDGSEPTESSPLYSSKLKIHVPSNVKAKAFLNTYDSSEVLNLNYTLKKLSTPDVS